MRERTLSARLVRMIGHARAEDESCAISIGEKAELLRQHVSGLEIRDEQNVGIAGDPRDDALDPRRVFADGVVERQRPVQQPSLDLPALGHLAQRGGVQRRGHLRVDRFDSSQDRDFRFADAQRDRQVDRVLADVHLVLERRRDIDGGVSDDEDLVVRGHVHDEHVTDTAPRAQPGFLGDDRAKDLIAVQASLHQELGFSTANQFHRLSRGSMAVRHVDNANLTKMDRACRRDLPDLVGRTDENGDDQSLLGSVDGACERRPLAWIRHRRRHRFKAAALHQQRFVLSGSNDLIH